MCCHATGRVRDYGGDPCRDEAPDEVPSQQRTPFFGPRTDPQRLIEVELVFASIRHAAKKLPTRAASFSKKSCIQFALDGRMLQWNMACVPLREKEKSHGC